MDLLQSYNSNSSSSPEDECLTEKEFRSVYLVTYSQADVAKFPTREVFARAIVESFSTGTAEVVQWVCCREMHRKGGGHCHLAIKLDRDLYSPRNDLDPEMIPNPEMIPKLTPK